jgi:hypothetical protein
MDLEKHESIQALIRHLTERFGDGAFPIEDFRPDTSEAIGFRSSTDPRIYFSVVTTGQPPGLYSIQVEIPRTDDAPFPFDLAVDREHLSMDEMLDVFHRYK